MRTVPKPRIATDDLVARYAAGDSLETIGRAVGIDSGAVRYRLLKAAVTLRPRNQGIAPRNKSAVTTDHIVALYRSGLSAPVIARQVGLAAKTIVDRLKRAGVNRRTRSDYSGAVGARNANWRGGRFTRNSGYVQLRVGGRYVFEHRFVMENLLKRKLARSEHVHHINGIRDDNRPENLVALDARAHKREGWTLVIALQTRIRQLEEQIKSHEAPLPARGQAGTERT
jgi:hypothetical protein